MTETAPIWWTRPGGVATVCTAGLGVFVLVLSALPSSLGVDAAIELYNAQSLEISYASRNPPVYDWLLFAIQSVFGPGNFSVALLNYGSLLALALLAYQLARRVIADPVLQALSVFSLFLLWDLGHEVHRILTHTLVMNPVVIATYIVLFDLARQRTVGRYLLLGALIAAGMLSKFAYAGFLAAAIVAALAVPEYRRVLLDRRIVLAAVVAAGPLALYAAGAASLGHSIVGSTGAVITAETGSGVLERIGEFLRSSIGYVIPFLPIFAAVFAFRRQPKRTPPDPAASAFLRFAGIIVAIGFLATVFWVAAIGSAQLRPRYFHAFWIVLPLLCFVWLDRFEVPKRSIQAFVRVTLVVFAVIVAEQVIVRVYPADWVCGSCRVSMPYRELGREIEARHGTAPTLVAAGSYEAGLLRLAVPGARVVSIHNREYRPPAGNDGACLLVWQPESGDPAVGKLAGRAGTAPAETLEIAWPAPLLSEPRVTAWRIAPIDDPELCG